MKILLLRLQAPLMSFGDADASEEHGPTMRHPGLSMLAGMIANALGYDHSTPEKTQAIQDRLQIASVETRRGAIQTDHQCAKLGKNDTGWTTGGISVTRGGHPYSYRGAQRRWKEYIADGEVVVALAYEGDIDEIATAFNRPARPLSIGRKCCIPTAPLVIGTIEAEGLIDALKSRGFKGHARWPLGIADAPPSQRMIAITDRRDWQTRLHAGERIVEEGILG